MELFIESILGVVGGIIGIVLVFFVVKSIENNLRIQTVLLIVLLDIMFSFGIQEGNAEYIAGSFIGLIVIGALWILLEPYDTWFEISFMASGLLIAIITGCIMRLA